MWEWLSAPFMAACVWQWLLVVVSFVVVAGLTDYYMARQKRDNIQRILAVYEKRNYRQDVVDAERERLEAKSPIEVAIIENEVLKEWY